MSAFSQVPAIDRCAGWSQLTCLVLKAWYRRDAVAAPPLRLRRGAHPNSSLYTPVLYRDTLNLSELLYAVAG